MARQTENQRAELKLVGPKHILPEAVNVNASLDHSWIQVLIDALQINVAADSGVYVCSWHYNSSAPKQGQGWRSEITEKVRQFTGMFDRKKRQYTVRLVYPKKNRKANVTPRNVPVNRSQQQHHGTRLKRQAIEWSFTSQHRKDHRQSVPVRKQARKDVVQAVVETFGDDEESTASSSLKNEYWDEDEMDVQASVPIVINPQGHAPHLVGNGGRGLVVEEADENEMDDDDADNASMVTGLTRQNLELRRQGIEYEDVKTNVERRVTRFSNAFFLKVKHEIRTVKSSQLWDRNVGRSPLACYMLQELFN